jgi:hypothetical protein
MNRHARLRRYGGKAKALAAFFHGSLPGSEDFYFTDPRKADSKLRSTPKAKLN